jgi:ADP-ribose pyrophosphatase YjhB (NUDIX family)
VSYLPQELYEQIEQSMPIACVDFVPSRLMPTGEREIGLILRQSPHGRVWCHLGGRIERGETMRQAVRRHAAHTLAADVALNNNPQPDYVYEWFPREIAPSDGTVFGDDPRKHAVGLTFVVELVGDPRPRNEALRFEYFPIGRLPGPLWPGCVELLGRLGLDGRNQEGRST